MGRFLILYNFYFIFWSDHKEIEHLKYPESTYDKDSDKPILMFELSRFPKSEALPHQAPDKDRKH